MMLLSPSVPAHCISGKPGPPRMWRSTCPEKARFHRSDMIAHGPAACRRAGAGRAAYTGVMMDRMFIMNRMFRTCALQNVCVAASACCCTRDAGCVTHNVMHNVRHRNVTECARQTVLQRVCCRASACAAEPVTTLGTELSPLVPSVSRVLPSLCASQHRLVPPLSLVLRASRTGTSAQHRRVPERRNGGKEEG